MFQPTFFQPRIVAAIALLIVLFASACSGTIDSDTAATSASDDAFDFDDSGNREESGSFDTAFEVAEGEPASEPRVAADEAADALTTGSAGVQQTTQLPDLGRDIIFTATIELASTDVSVATRDAIRSIEGRGGFLFSQETRGGAGGSSVLTFKVLPDQFQAALDDLGSIGKIRSQSISADDVTAVVVDLESRINTAEASVLRLRKLLDEASELETIATLENQLLQRETTLEQLRGQLRSVRNQVDLATITVVVTELLNRPGLAVSVMSFAGHDAGFSCFDAPNVRSGETGEAITLCYQLTNTGDTSLIDLAINDAILGASIESMLVVDGTVSGLEPGESVTLAQEFELSEPFRVRATATAVGLNDDSDPLDDEVQATAPIVRFDVTDLDDGFPSFGEVLNNSWNALAAIAIVLALAAVAIAPFLLVALVLWIPARTLLRRIQAAKPVQPAQPAPPGPPAPPATIEEDEETKVAN